MEQDAQNRSASLSSSAIKFLFLALCLLLPLFFLPTTFEFFDFNKISLIYIIVATSLIFYGIRMVASKKFFIKRSFLDLPLLLIVIVYLLSAFFSENKFNALVGNQGNWGRSLITTLSLYLYYYTISSNLTKKSFLLGLKMVATGSFLSAVLFIPAIFGFDFIKSPWSAGFFNTFGSMFSGLLFWTIGLVLSVCLVLFSEEAREKSIFSLFSSAIAIPLVVSGNFVLVGVALLGIGVALFTASSKQLKPSYPFLASLASSVLIFAIVSLVPEIKNTMGMKTLPKEYFASIRASWAVASSVIGEHPFFGTGLANFQSSYARFKPAYINYENTWNVRFNFAGAEYINILATTGIAGILVWAFLAWQAVRKAFIKENGTKSTILDEDADETLSQIISVLLVTILVTMLVRPSTLSVITILFIVFAGLAITKSTNMYTKASLEVPPAVLTIFAVLSGTLLYFLGRAYLADYYFRQSINDLAQGGTKTYNLQRQAVILNPINELYRSNYAQANLALATALAQRQDLTDSDKADIQQLVSQAIRESRVLTETLSPFNPDAWEVRGSIYRSLNQVAENAPSWAIEAYNNAITLDPNNPRIRVDLGGIYFTNKDYQNAAAVFASATRLKNDYANAHYNLAQAYKQLKDMKNAQTELEIVQRLIPEGSEDAKAVAEELVAVKAEVAKEQSANAQNKPSVEQLEAKGTQPTTPQQPLTNPQELEQPVL